jgi:hypothetical protein
LKQKWSQLTWRFYAALWIKDVRGAENLLEKLKAAAEALNPVESIKHISPRPVLIIHRKHDPFVDLKQANELDRNALEPKTLIVDEGWMHPDDNSFFSSPTRRDGAITLTDNWVKKTIPQ